MTSLYLRTEIPNDPEAQTLSKASTNQQYILVYLTLDFLLIYLFLFIF